MAKTPAKVNDIIKNIEKDPKVRIEAARHSHLLFFHIYLSEYIKYRTADFQKEMFSITEDENIGAAVIVAFRGSAKSTIMSLSYPIWAMVGSQEKKFITIFSQTQRLAKAILGNIKSELEKNSLLARDFGPFKEVSSQWSSDTLLVNGYGCQIASMSCGESLRGIRHKQHRPDLIICDDVEDLSSVKVKESRKKTYSWFTGEVLPAGDRNTKTIIIGNMLHEDSLMVRLKKDVDRGSLSGIYRQFPLLDSKGSPLWPGKYKDRESIQKLKKSTGSETSYQREYLLKIIAEEDKVVSRGWIKYYDDFPEDKKLMYIGTGIDLAISEKASADYTAMVSARVYGSGENIKIYILSYPVNKRMDFPKTVEAAKRLSTALGEGKPTTLYIEDVGYQRSLIQQLKKDGYRAVGVKLKGRDKRERINLITLFIKNGMVLFPKEGCEDLIGQLTGFGYEAHDDLADAFTILILEIIKKRRKPRIVTGGIL